jgi:hypothetical protein
MQGKIDARLGPASPPFAAPVTRSLHAKVAASQDSDLFLLGLGLVPQQSGA